MTILRTICPQCDIVRVRAPEATLRQLSEGSYVEVEFDCPTCSGHVVQQLNARMMPLLLSAGCAVAHDFGVDACGGITEAEIDEFVAALDRNDWMDELAH